MLLLFYLQQQYPDNTRQLVVMAVKVHDDEISHHLRMETVAIHESASKMRFFRKVS
jgi:hypothetical protein